MFKHLFRLIQADILHPHQYDLAEYRDMLQNRGLVVKKEHRAEKRFLFDYYVLVAEKPV